VRVPSFHGASRDHRFAAAAASFGMLLRDSECKGSSTHASVLRMAESSAGGAPYRREFVSLARKAQGLSR